MTPDFGLQLRFEKVPSTYTAMINQWLSQAWGLNGIVNPENNYWASSPLLTHPQGKRMGKFFPQDNSIVSQPHDPKTITHEEMHRYFNGAIKGSLGNLGLEDALNEGMAFMFEAAVFGDPDSAARLLSQSFVYSPQQSEMYSLLLNWFYVFGAPLLQKLIEEPKQQLDTMLSRGKSWEFSLLKIQESLQDHFRRKGGNVTDEKSIVNEISSRYRIHPAIAQDIYREGSYENLSQALLDVSPAKVNRIHAYHRIASALFFHGGYPLLDAAAQAQKAARSSLYGMILSSLSRIEDALSPVAEIGDENLTKKALEVLTRRAVESPAFGEGLKSNFWDSGFIGFVKAISTSRSSAKGLLEKFVDDVDFRELIVTNGGMEFIKKYAKEAGNEYTLAVLNELIALDFGLVRGVYTGPWGMYDAQTHRMRGVVDPEDHRIVIENLPKFTAAGYLTGFFDQYYQGQRVEKENNQLHTLWHDFKTACKQKFPYLDMGWYYSGHDSKQDDIYIFGKSTDSRPGDDMVIFLQMYNHAKQSATAQRPWETIFKDDITAFYNLTNDFIKSHAHLNPRRGRF